MLTDRSGESSATVTREIAEHGVRRFGLADPAIVGDELEQELRQVVEGDRDGPARAIEQPVGQLHEAFERLSVVPYQGREGSEVSAVDDEIEIPGESLEPLHCRIVDGAVAKDVVRRRWVVDHLPFAIVSGYGRAAQALEDAYLDLMDADPDETVEALADAANVLPGKADNEIRVKVGTGLFDQPAQV